MKNQKKMQKQRTFFNLLTKFNQIFQSYLIKDLTFIWSTLSTGMVWISSRKMKELIMFMDGTNGHIRLWPSSCSILWPQITWSPSHLSSTYCYIRVITIQRTSRDSIACKALPDSCYWHSLDLLLSYCSRSHKWLVLWYSSSLFSLELKFPIKFLMVNIDFMRLTLV